MQYALNVTCLDWTNFCTILLIEKIIRDTDFGGAALLKGIVDGEWRAWVAKSDTRVSAVAPNIWVLTLRRCWRLMSSIINIGAGR